MINFHVKNFIGMTPYHIILALTVHGNFHKINFRSRH